MKAAESGRIRVVQYLIEQLGVDVNATTKDGYLVEKCGADVHTKTTKGDTALRVAADRGFQDIQRILMPFVQLRPKPIH
ncbi:Ankyrin repeat-containing domain [Phytophthora cactorum]|nr:Ankyrin repeat-containing domain [Phytophthora cactorum]